MKKLICAVTVLAVSTAQAGVVIHVDDDAPLGGDGTSWGTAYRLLQDALADAAASGGAEVRVAQGLYTPDQDESGNVTSNSVEIRAPKPRPATAIAYVCWASSPHASTHL